MHYYKKNIGDYAKKAGRLTMLQHGAYTLLLDSCYDREIFPTLEEAIEWTWASTREEVEAVEFVLKKFFALEDGRYVQNRIREELEKFHENSETNKRIAREREAKRRDQGTKRGATVDEPPPNQQPITNNQVIEGTNVPSCPPNGERKVLPECDHQEVIRLYHEVCPTLPRVEVWNDTRAGYLRQRWREVAIDLAKQGKVSKDALVEWWKDFFQFVSMSDFLMGRVPNRTGKPFLADLEWLIKPTNFAKVIENRYHRK